MKDRKRAQPFSYTRGIELGRRAAQLARAGTTTTPHRVQFAGASLRNRDSEWRKSLRAHKFTDDEKRGYKILSHTNDAGEVAILFCIYEAGCTPGGCRYVTHWSPFRRTSYSPNRQSGLPNWQY